MVLKPSILVVKGLFTAILLLVICDIYKLGVAWEETTVDVDVYTIQDPRFWGPMTMLVPNNCTFLQGRMSAGTSPRMWELPMEFDAQPPPDMVQTNLLGHPILPAQDVVNFVALHKCGLVIDAPNASWVQYYFAAMETASTDFDIDAMHTSRMRFFWLFVFACLSENFMGIAVAAKDEVRESVGKKITHELGRKFKGFMSQLMLLTLFITFWHEDHYIMNYLPGRAYVLLYASLPLALCIPFLQVPEGTESSCGQKTIGCLLCGWCSYLMCVVVIPLGTGFTLYNMQFLCMLASRTYLSEVDGSQQHNVDQLISWFLGLNLLDFILTSAVYEIEGCCKKKDESPDAELANPLIQQ